MLHHGFKKGRRVLIILKSGEKIVDKFVDSNSNCIIMENGRYDWKDIRATTINKNRLARKGVIVWLDKFLLFLLWLLFFLWVVLELVFIFLVSF